MKKIFQKMFLSSFIYGSKAPETKSTERNKSQCPKSTTVCNGKTSIHFFVQLCRQNDQSDDFKVFSAFESSIKAFDTIFENMLFS